MPPNFQSKHCLRKLQIMSGIILLKSFIYLETEAIAFPLCIRTHVKPVLHTLLKMVNPPLEEGSASIGECVNSSKLYLQLFDHLNLVLFLKSLH